LNDARWITAERYGTRLADILLAREAYAQPNFRFFRWFAVYPSLLRIDVGNPERCVWFQDLRFVTPGREGTPFRYGMCREGDGSWQAFQLVDEGRRAVY
jgi:inner membrane protein